MKRAFTLIERLVVILSRTHDRKQPQQFNNARNVMSFVDGHVSYIPIYWNGSKQFDDMPAFHA